MPVAFPGSNAPGSRCVFLKKLLPESGWEPRFFGYGKKRDGRVILHWTRRTRIRRKRLSSACTTTHPPDYSTGLSAYTYTFFSQQCRNSPSLLAPAALQIERISLIPHQFTNRGIRRKRGSPLWYPNADVLPPMADHWNVPRSAKSSGVSGIGVVIRRTAGIQIPRAAPENTHLGSSTAVPIAHHGNVS